MKAAIPKPQRCAIYTRKSTEHNLDLAFNSLDAQREACEAYIKSQASQAPARQKFRRFKNARQRPGAKTGLETTPARYANGAETLPGDASH